MILTSATVFHSNSDESQTNYEEQNSSILKPFAIALTLAVASVTTGAFAKNTNTTRAK